VREPRDLYADAIDIEQLGMPGVAELQELHDA
jgi:hypothetical protein